MQGAEGTQGDLPQRRDHVHPDEGLVAVVGGGPDPGPGVGQPVLQVLPYLEVLGLQPVGLRHGRRMLALGPGHINAQMAP